jgi:hypothetical protein
MIASIDLDGENIHQIPKFTTIYSIKTVHQSQYGTAVTDGGVGRATHGKSGRSP